MKRLILHIGQHKTGSKALQAFLAHNRLHLLAHGILYPNGSLKAVGVPAYRNSHYLLYALLRHQLELETCRMLAARTAPPRNCWPPPPRPQLIRSSCPPKTFLR